MAPLRSSTIARRPLASSSVRLVVSAPSIVTVRPSRVFAVAIDTTDLDPAAAGPDGFGVADDTGPGRLTRAMSARSRTHSR